MNRALGHNVATKNIATSFVDDTVASLKVLYEEAYPETKVGVSQAVSMNRTLGHNVATKLVATSFVADTSAKTGSSETIDNGHSSATTKNIVAGSVAATASTTGNLVSAENTETNFVAATASTTGSLEDRPNWSIL